MSERQLRDCLKREYLIDFPDDLFGFWEFTQDFSASTPLLTFRNALGIHLVGPLEVLAGKREPPPGGWYLGTRYYDDPPEFFTIFSGDTDGLHWGYWFDDPDHSTNYCLADYFSLDAYDIMEEGSTLFEAFRLQLEGCHASTLENIAYDPDIKQNQAAYDSDLEVYALYRSHLMRYATQKRPEVGTEYRDKYARESNRAVAGDTLEGMGIVVPASRYRPLSVNDEELWAKITGYTDLSEIVTEAERALAEGFPGTALKFGRDLWIGSERQKQDSYRLLNSAYKSLNRPTLRTLLAQIESVRKK